MSSKVFCATIHFSKSYYFKIPDGIDLDDKSVVEYYGYKWGELLIKYVGKDEKQIIQPCYEDDLLGGGKYADEEDIIDDKECPFYESEEEEEEEDEVEFVKEVIAIKDDD